MLDPYLREMNGFGAAPSLFSNSPEVRPWAYVTRRFLTLQSNLVPKPAAIEDGNKKVAGVVSTLNRAFRGENVVANYVVAGSWGKGTVIHPPTDIDLCFILPESIFYQFDARAGNKQSQLLQHVKDVLGATYSQTAMRGDGQVVVIAFNSIIVEVVPAFIARDRGIIICDTNNGGRWKQVDPLAEIGILERSDNALRGNHRKIARIFKQWMRHCDVSIKAFHLEQLIGEALPTISWGSNDEFWFDWIVRDVFRYMIGRAGGGFFMPGGFNEWIDLGDAWKSKAETAYQRALLACDYERDNMNISAGGEWQKIFGTAIPEMVI
ncbi:SMODS domain-containing nucleotidyltransferase [Sinisalibacter aestuarii]|uniref:Nucleotidyltransferase n=1 Tax=Sinisalibacter aestuarii TaxID=2949426 RepID=A0ABQ5LX16_9RHOB|nr:hypothetical protein [Sinisalibacter aestuarii]GKY89308.1 hypothetical protein STA1M1_31770 [Sinisalibacter aestuarii]